MPSPGVQRGDVEAGGVGPRSGGSGGGGLGTAESGAELAGALADALAGAQVDSFGAYAADDLEGFAADEADYAEDMSIEQERQDLAERIAEIDAAIAGSTQATGPAGTGAASNPFAGPATGVVDDFSGGNFGLTGPEQFADWGAPTPTSIEETQMGMAAPMFGQTAPAQGYQDILGSGAGLAQATQFAGQPMTAPGQSTSPYSSDYGTYATPQASQYGAMSQLGLTGHQFAQGNPIGYAGPYDITTSQNVEDQIGGKFHGAAAVDTFTNMPLGDAGTMATEQFDSGIAGESGATQGQGGLSGQIAPFNLAGGLINQGGSTPFSETTGGQGAITAGTVSASPETAAGEAAVAAGTAGTQAQISQDVNAVKQEAAQYVTPTQTAIDLEVQNTSARLDQEAAQKREQYGTFSKEYQKAQRIANAFKTLDAYSKSYSSVHGKSFLGELLGGKFSLTGAIKSVEGWLQDKFGAQAAGQTGEQIAAMLEEAYNKGTLNEVLRELQGGGPSTEDVEGPKEIRAFIQQYPWAAELDPKYIKYLIDNPAELQDLLGQGGENQS